MSNFWPKSGHGRLRNLIVVSYERVFETVFDWETKQNSNKTVYLQSGLLQEVVAYEKWSLWESWLYVYKWMNCFLDNLPEW